MELKYFQVAAFTDKLFSGNPAIVVELNEWLDNITLQNIARENSIDATAFFIEKDEEIELRWFTPDLELDLCGHATLATAFVLSTLKESRKDFFTFKTNSGLLHVSKKENLFIMDLPSRKPVKTDLPTFIKNSINKAPREVLKARDYLLIYDSEVDVRNIQFDKQIFNSENIDPGGVIITAPGKKTDFVSRFFVPQATILEDPVTGSAHASLIPYWSNSLNKREMTAHQLSARKGKLYCTNNEDRVLLAGNAKLYASGTLFL